MVRNNNAKLNTPQGLSPQYKKSVTSRYSTESIIFFSIYYVPDTVNILVNTTVMVPALRI